MTETYKTEAKAFFMNGVPFWNTFCECKKHKGQKMARISKASVWGVAEKLDFDPLTEKGAKALNHALLNGIEALKGRN